MTIMMSCTTCISASGRSSRGMTWSLMARRFRRAISSNGIWMASCLAIHRSMRYLAGTVPTARANRYLTSMSNPVPCASH